MIREPAVAGAFYESNVKYLRESIEDCFKHRLGPKELPKLSRINKEKQSVKDLLSQINPSLTNQWDAIKTD